MEFHYRVSVVSEAVASSVCDAVYNMLKDDINTFACAYEVKDDNHHIHCHIEYKTYNEETFKKRRQKLISQLKEKQQVPDCKEAQYHEKLKKDRFTNLVYCFKGRKYLKHNLTDEEVKKIEEENERIDNEKDIPMKMQLYDLWVANNPNRFFRNKYEAYSFIDMYHVERDYLPPTFSLKTQYAIFIVMKQLKIIEQRTNTNTLYHSIMYDLQGIRMDYEEHQSREISRIMNKLDNTVNKFNNSDFIDSESEEENDMVCRFS